MAISDDIQHVVIEMDGIDKLMELLWLAFQQPTATMEHAISSMGILRKQVNETEEHLQEILEAVERKEVDRDSEYKT
mgnify:FL=1|jgi:hypothetical protein